MVSFGVGQARTVGVRACLLSCRGVLVVLVWCRGWRGVVGLLCLVPEVLEVVAVVAGVVVHDVGVLSRRVRGGVSWCGGDAWRLVCRTGGYRVSRCRMTRVPVGADARALRSADAMSSASVRGGSRSRPGLRCVVVVPSGRSRTSVMLWRGIRVLFCYWFEASAG